MHKPGLKIFFAFLCLFSASVLAQNLPDKVSFIPHWLPQAQFAGYFAANDLGIYKKYDIDLDILVGGPQNSSTELCRKKGADFYSLWLANALALRDQGCKIVNIGQIVRRSVFMLIAKKSSGIKEPGDFDGRKVALWEGFELRPMQFFKKFGAKVKTVPLGSTINIFLMDGVDAANGMYYNEYHQIINSGYDPDELVTFFLSDYGFNFPEEGIYVYEDFYRKNEDLCRRFISATIEGWMWCFKNPEKALEIVVKYMKAVNLPVNLSQQKWMLSVFKDLLIDPESRDMRIQLSRPDYDYVVRTIKDAGQIKSAPEFSDFFVPIKGFK